MLSITMFMPVFAFNINMDNHSVLESYEARRWKVTIIVRLVYKYYNESFLIEGEEDGGTSQEIVYVSADTPYEAETKAMNKCLTMCNSSGENLGSAKYNGKDCTVYLYRITETARAEAID